MQRISSGHIHRAMRVFDLSIKSRTGFVRVCQMLATSPDEIAGTLNISLSVMLYM